MINTFSEFLNHTYLYKNRYCRQVQQLRSNINKNLAMKCILYNPPKKLTRSEKFAIPSYRIGQIA